MFQSAKRMEAFEESIFSELSHLKKIKVSQGFDVVDLSIGSPDLPPPKFIMDTLAEECKNPSAYGYSLSGTTEFNRSVCTYYEKTHSINLDSESQVVLLMGSQDGLVHLPMALCDAGDYMLVPDPGYTAYAAGAALSGAKMYSMSVLKENGFLPNFKEIPIHIAQKAKLMILNFPGNPVPAMATKEYFEEAVQFAKKHNLVIIHDFAYSELYFKEKPISFLSVEGAMDVGIEMNSLSKSFNMAGTRIAYAAGNKDIIQLLSKLKSNLDYGVFLPVQKAASLALKDASDYLSNMREIYKNRRDILINGFKDLGWNVDTPQASMFIWAKVPTGYTSKQFSLELLNKANVVVTPGNAFGKLGEGYVRIALVQNEQRLKQALSQINLSKIFNLPLNT